MVFVLTAVLWLTGMMESGYKSARGVFMCGCEHANNIGICEECYKKTLVDNDLEEFGPLFKDFRLFSQKYQNRVLKLAFLQSNTFWAENGKRIDSEFEKMKNQYKSLYELTIPNDAL